jgi:RNA polymerase sigma-70 factor (sigma-E family)
MTRLAYLLTLDHSRAEELVQEAFTKLWRRRDRLPDADKRAAYLRSVVLNEARMALRRRVLERRHAALALDQDESAGDPDWHVDMMRGLAGLPLGKRTVLVLRYYLDWDEATIARELGTSVGTVKSQASKGLAQLRRSLQANRQDRLPHALRRSP